jgi:hypothetical protein
VGPIDLKQAQRAPLGEDVIHHAGDAIGAARIASTLFSKVV